MGGLLAGMAVANLVPAVPAHYVMVAGISALVPDIDTPHSTISRRTSPFISGILNLFFGHRGLFHSLLAPAGLTFVVYILGGKILALVFFTGYLSHLLLDMLTPAGVRIFYPFSLRLSIPLVRTGGVIENIVMLGLTLCLILLGIKGGV